MSTWRKDLTFPAVIVVLSAVGFCAFTLVAAGVWPWQFDWGSLPAVAPV